MCIRACVGVRACVRAYAYVHACVCVRVRVYVCDRSVACLTEGSSVAHTWCERHAISSV